MTMLSMSDSVAPHITPISECHLTLWPLQMSQLKRNRPFFLFPFSNKEMTTPKGLLKTVLPTAHVPITIIPLPNNIEC